MKPYYQDDAVTLYHGDCLDVLPTLQPPCNALVTDPPFAFTGGSSNGTSAPISEQFYEHWWRDVATQMVHSLVSTGSGFIWCDWRTSRSIAKGFEPKQGGKCFWRVPQMLYHYRERPGLGQPFRSSVDMIAYVRGPKHKDPPISKSTHNHISQCYPYGKHKHHPAEKSLELVSRLLRWCARPGDLVLDPFAGSGTTLRAAKGLGRKAIGIEREECYCEVAAKRMAQETLFPLLQESSSESHEVYKRRLF